MPHVLLVLLLGTPAALFAGGSAFRTLVVVNTNSADSVELGNYYAAAHGIPAHHICRLGVATNLATVNSNEFQSLLRSPITNHIAANGLAGQIDFLVLCQDIPTRVRNVEGVSASLFYGFKNAPGYNEGGIGCNLPDYAFNTFYRAERAFRSADSWNATNGWVAFHLIASNLATAKLVVDRGAAAQSSFPAAAAYLFIQGDAPRGVREQLFPNTQFSFASLPGLPAACTIGTYYTTLSGQTNVIGYHDGYGTIAGLIRTNNTWLSGTYADHMTSYGGRIENFTNATGHSTILDWMGIGATASYGTVAEPCNYLEKFPDPLMALYYARGFTIGESYAMAVAAPYQGLFAGDPLAAPFAAPPAISVTAPVPYQIVSGTVPVPAAATAHANGVPAAALDLYVDGRFHAHLASLGPTPGNILSVAVAGRTNSAIVAASGTLCDAVAALAEAVNADPDQMVSASAFGDRLELIYENFDHEGDNLPVSAFVSTGTASALTLGVGLAANRLVPSVYSAREHVALSTHTTNGANAGDTLTNIITLADGAAVTNVLVATQDESARNLLERLRTAINTHTTLMAANGVFYDRLSSAPNTFGAWFARTPGPDGRRIQIDFFVHAVSNSSGLKTNSSFSSRMDDNEGDLRPRASVLFHVRPTNDVLAAMASVDTTTLSDGLHVLDFVAQDGSAVAAQSRLSLPLLVANTSRVLSVSSAHGTGTPPVGTHFHPPGAVLTNSVSTPEASGGTQLVCTGWAMAGHDPAGGSAAQFEMTVTNHASLVWLWTTNYWLDTEAGPHGAVDAADAWQPAGVVTQITASADPYYHFAHWTGSVSGTNNPLALWMDAPKAVQADFGETLAASNTPHWWLAAHGWTSDFDEAATRDAEPDGFFTWQEYIADTDPTNAASHPRVGSIATDGPAPVLAWPFSTGRIYQIHRADDLVVGPWITQELSLGSGEWTDTNPPPAGRRFYRIAPRLP